MTMILPSEARRAGFELAVAHDLFIHHFGSRTFAGNGIDAEKLLRRTAASSPRSGERAVGLCVMPGPLSHG